MIHARETGKKERKCRVAGDNVNLYYLNWELKLRILMNLLIFWEEKLTNLAVLSSRKIQLGKLNPF